MADSTLGTLFRPVTAPVNAVAERLRPFIAPLFQGGVQAAPPQMSAPPRTPFEGLPAPPRFSAGVDTPPPTGGLGSLPVAPGGTSAGWMQVPQGTHFDPSILAPPSDPGASFNGTVTSPAGNTYSALPHGSLVDLEGQARTRNLLDAIYPELAPQNQAAVAEQELKVRMATPLRPGEEAPILPQAAMAQQQKQRSLAGYQSALQDIQQRHTQVLQALHQKLQQGQISQAQFDAEKTDLDTLATQESQAINLRFAPEFAPRFDADLLTQLEPNFK